MAESAYTRGVWRPRTMTMSRRDWASLGGGEIDVVLRGADVVAAVWCGDDVEGGGQANARLIAAAPDLVEALQAVDLARLTDLPKDWERATVLTDAALARALGKEG